MGITSSRVELVQGTTPTLRSIVTCAVQSGCPGGYSFTATGRHLLRVGATLKATGRFGPSVPRNVELVTTSLETVNLLKTVQGRVTYVYNFSWAGIYYLQLSNTPTGQRQPWIAVTTSSSNAFGLNFTSHVDRSNAGGTLTFGAPASIGEFVTITGQDYYGDLVAKTAVVGPYVAF